MVMNRVLGGGPASRLFRNIREDKGYTYGISSGFSASHYYNHFVSSTNVRTEVTGPALDELLKEFRDIRDRAVPAEELEVIFQPFRQGHLGTAKEGKSAGLGLAIANSIARGHGGRLWAESMPPNGASFFVLLPVSGTST